MAFQTNKADRMERRRRPYIDLTDDAGRVPARDRAVAVPSLDEVIDLITTPRPAGARAHWKVQCVRCMRMFPICVYDDERSRELIGFFNRTANATCQTCALTDPAAQMPPMPSDADAGYPYDAWPTLGLELAGHTILVEQYVAEEEGPGPNGGDRWVLAHRVPLADPAVGPGDRPHVQDLFLFLHANARECNCDDMPDNLFVRFAEEAHGATGDPAIAFSNQPGAEPGWVAVPNAVRAP